MPKLQKVFILEVTPEQFLENCSAIELWELQMLLQSQRFQMKMSHLNLNMEKADDED